MWPKNIHFTLVNIECLAPTMFGIPTDNYAEFPLASDTFHMMVWLVLLSI